MSKRIHDNEMQSRDIKSSSMMQSCEQLEALKKAIFNTSMTNDLKLKQVKEKLSLGQYQIQSHSLASKLLEHANAVDACEMV